MDKSSVLGRLGRFTQTHARKNFELPQGEGNCVDRGSTHVSVPSVPTIVLDKHEEFKRLYKKFVDGSRWLNQKIQDGTAREKDKEEFNKRVVEPMDALWATFTDEEKDYWGKVKYAVDLFEGTIVLEDEEKKRKQAEERSKRKKSRWRNYSRSY